MSLRADSNNSVDSTAPGDGGTVTGAPTPALPAFRARFICPSCRAPLEPVAGRYRCPAEALDFKLEDGIWRFLSPQRVEYFAQFLHEYETVRRAEGRNSPNSDYYRALPFEDRTQRFARDWAIRATSFETLVARVLRPLEVRRPSPLTMLDLGAGNGWLSHRLARRGHNVAAIDLSLSGLDGLGAHIHYVPAFTPIQAEFDRLPFDDEQVDLVIFNASLHYSADILATLNEASRVLRRDGLLVVMDSPVYRDRSSGLAMVSERERDFTKRYGFPSNAVPMENFLTYERLDNLAASTGFGWQLIRPRYGIGWALRGWRARLRRSREPASFVLIVGARRSAALRGALPRRLWRRVLSIGIPLKQYRMRRPVLEWADGKPLIVLPRVFNPKVMRSGEFLARVLDRQPVDPSATVLDMGTGSGIGAITAARWAKRVVAIDINPEAVRCARLNALLNRVEDRVDVQRGDLFEPVAGQRFDLVLFNPPYFRGEPRDLLDRAWRATDVVERFIRYLPAHLTPEGSALIVLSTDGSPQDFLAAARAEGFLIEVAARRDFVNEVLTVYRLRHGGAATV